MSIFTSYFAILNKKQGKITERGVYIRSALKFNKKSQKYANKKFAKPRSFSLPTRPEK